MLINDKHLLELARCHIKPMPRLHYHRRKAVLEAKSGVVIYHWENDIYTYILISQEEYDNLIKTYQTV